jgi:hypothetical protein
MTIVLLTGEALPAIMRAALGGLFFNVSNAARIPQRHGPRFLIVSLPRN